MSKPWLKHYPPSVPAEISVDKYASLVDLLDQACKTHARRPALTFMGSHVSYSRLDRAADAVAAWLQGQGLQPGSRIGLMLPNTPAYMVALLGALRAGMVVVNINPASTAHELGFMLTDSGAQLVFVFDSMLAVFDQLAQLDDAAMAEAGKRCQLVNVLPGDLLGIRGWAINRAFAYKQGKYPKGPANARAVRFTRVLAKGQRQPLRKTQASLDDLAILQYTGGTTGIPKGAMLSHGNLVANVLQMQAVAQPVLPDGQGAGMVTLAALPLCHIFALTVCGLFSMHMGMQCVLVADPRRLATVVKAWQLTPVSLFPSVNTLFNALLRHNAFAQLNFSALRLCFGGGAPVQQAVAQRWQALTGLPIIEGYGLSETAPVALVNPVNSSHYSGDIGFPIPSTLIKIIDDEGKPLPAGTEGEIAIYGPQVSSGYWNQPAETAAAFTADGYFRTGDIGIMNDDGRVRIVDRKKDMALVAGFNVYPNEIEQVAAAHPGVQECMAFGVPNPATGEKLMLFVVKADEALNEETLRAWLAERLSTYKRPHRIQFIDELPKSHAGKLLRRVLRDKELAKQQGLAFCNGVEASDSLPEQVGIAAQTAASGKGQPEALASAVLEFDERGVPFSSRYQDVYHPAEGALAQAAYVFLAGNGLPERWRGAEQYRVCEAGFGLGHNFLALWKAWRDDPQRSKHLDVISFEAHPFQADDLVRGLADLPDSYVPLLARLLEHWPGQQPGIHRLTFTNAAPPSSGGPTAQYTLGLTLVFGDIRETLPGFLTDPVARQMRVNAFFLDGFAPRTNPEMWTPCLLLQLAGLAAPGATAATWSSAAQVRLALSDAGFVVQRQKGFANKKHMTVAQLA